MCVMNRTLIGSIFVCLVGFFVCLFVVFDVVVGFVVFLLFFFCFFYFFWGGGGVGRPSQQVILPLFFQLQENPQIHKYWYRYMAFVCLVIRLLMG